MVDECVIDTNVLQRANAPLIHEPREGSQFRRRLAILERISRGHLIVLWSRQLLAEYTRNIREPRNDQVRVFFEILDRPGRAIMNWYAPWSGNRVDMCRRCRYPEHDDHLLRTAIRPAPSTIFTEENALLGTGRCIYRRFRVRIRCP